MRSARQRRILKVTLAVVLFSLAGGLVVSWFVAGTLVAASPRDVGDPPADLNAAAFTIASDSGALISGWHTRPERSDGVVVLLHGIRSSRLAMLERARLLHADGFATVMIDLQAHGQSSGSAITVGHLEKHDVRAAVDFARRMHPSEKIGVIGVSLGGAAAVLASPLGIDALAIESVYPDIDTAIHNRVSARLGPLSPVAAALLLVQLQPRLGISRSELRPIDHLSDLGCPVLVASGAADRHTTVSETRAIFDAAPEPKELWLVDGAAHVDLLEADPQQYHRRVIRFLRRHLRADPKRPSAAAVRPEPPPPRAPVALRG